MCIKEWGNLEEAVGLGNIIFYSRLWQETTMKEKNLNKIDKFIYNFLKKNVDVMPKRLGKIIALYYTDARIRKKYSKFIQVEMGEGTYANLGLKVVPNENPICVHIGANVSIAPNVTFLAGTEPNNSKELKKIPYIKEQAAYFKDIYVDDDAWIGAGAIIFPGIRIGKGSIIGAGSVVRHDTEPYCVYAGVPAKKIKEIPRT